MCKQNSATNNQWASYEGWIVGWMDGWIIFFPSFNIKTREKKHNICNSSGSEAVAGVVTAAVVIKHG